MSDRTVAWASVYKNVKSNDVLVVAKVVGPNGRTEIGDPIRISDDELESLVAVKLLRALDSFATNVYSLEATRPMSTEDYQTFRKHHLSVSVERLESGDIVFLPLHHVEGGYGGKYAEQVVVAKQDVPAMIPAALREALRVAT